MDQKLIYTDVCNEIVAETIKKELDLEVLLMYSKRDWNINDSLRLVTMPEIDLVVINVINEMTLLEISLLGFLCKPILVTAKDISEYPLVERIVQYIDQGSDLRTQDTNFIQWYKLYRS